MENYMNSRGIPAKIPNDLRELIYNLNKLEDAQRRIDIYYTYVDDQIKSVGEILTNNDTTIE